MAKQLNINLGFTADTQKAKAQLNDLQNQLTKVMNVSTSGLDNKLTSQLQEASKAAAELKAHLHAATNAQTGSLDFTVLNQSLKQSKTSLSEYAYKIRDIGPAGEQAFLTLAKSVMSAEVPIKRSNALLTEMWTTLKNTARWQLSSSILHGFAGAVQSAYGYAQDLNESLNNIRIVTGYNVDEMTKFAEAANKSAKALSATTTEYTNASLIYYQQGLTAEEVQKRTDITIKMANVARQSAEVVSNQMTAVWNNFYDGTKSLEYYADVMTALGAKTASSTDEIAGGLEKFAAIGDTIGLSFDYAASALATITSNTRQSEEVVGTALKTIFARIQGLNLGETLDDGTTLNKYSEALQKVGISIFDQAGELKTMDALLNEMGSKWDTLNSAQQTALAQTVAGVRQYTQLVALMENWDNGDSDSFQANLLTTQTSTGALQEQADIYAESWEAANDRVKASLENIFDKLINDEFFIGVFDTLSDIIDGVGKLIDRMGGLRGVLSTVGVVFTKVFSKQLSENLDNLSYNITNFFDGGQGVRQEKISEIRNLLEDLKKRDEIGNSETATTNQVLNAQIESQEYLIENAKNLSIIEKETLQHLIDQQQVRGDQAIEAARQEDKAKEKLSDMSAKVQGYHGLGGPGDTVRTISKGSMKTIDLKSLTKEAKEIGKATANLKKGDDDAKKALEHRKRLLNDEIELYGEKNKVDEKAMEDLKAYGQAAIEAGYAEEVRIQKTVEATKSIISSSEVEKQNNQQTEINTQEKKENNQATKENTEKEKENSQAIKENTEKEKENAQATEQAGEEKKEAANDIKQETQGLKENTEAQRENIKLSSEGFVTLANSTLSAISAISMLSSAFETIKDPDLSDWEKFSQTITSVGMALPMLFNSLNQLSNISITVGGTATSLGKHLGSKGLGGAFAKLAGDTTSALGSIAALIPYLAIAAAAIGAVTVAVKLAVDAYNKDANAAKKAAETAKQLAEAHQEAKDSLNDLKSAFSTYDTAVEALDECVKGTKEWDEALKNVNETVFELLSQYPELLKNANLFTRNNQGMLEINESQRDLILQQAEDKAMLTQASAIMGSAMSAQAQLISETTDLNRGMGRTYMPIMLKYTMDNGYTKSAQPELDIGELLTSNIEKLKDLDEQKFRDEIEKIFRDDTSKYADWHNYEASIDILVERYKDYQDEIQKLADQTKAVTTQMEQASQVLVDQRLGDGYTETEKAIATNKFQNLYNDILDDLNTKNSDMQNTDDADSEIYQGIVERVEAAGLGLRGLESGNAVIGTDGNRKLVFLDEQGNKVKKDFTWVAQQLATAEALKELGQSANEARDTLKHLSETVGSSESDAIQDLIANGKMNTMSAEDRQALSSALRGDFTQESIIDYLSKVLDTDEKGLKIIFGQETLEDVYALFIDAWEDNADALANAGNFLSETPSQYFKSTNTSNLDAYEKSDFANILQTAFNEAGSVGVESFINAFNKTVVEDQGKLINALNDIDWATTNVQELEDVLEDAGIDINITKEQLQQMIHAMTEGSKYSLDTITEKYNGLKEIIDSLKTGDTISPEKYTELTEEQQKYFTYMADGTWALIADAKEFYNIVKNESLTSFVNTVHGLKEKINILEVFDLGKLKDTSVKDQLSLINTLELGTEEQRAEWAEGLARGDLSIETKEAIIKSINEWVDNNGGIVKAQEQLSQIIADTQAELEKTQSAIASMANNFYELDGLMADGNITNSDYAEQLMVLASKYDDCTTEIKEFRSALASGSDENVAETQEMLKASLLIAEASEQYELNAKAVKAQAKTYDLNAIASAKLAIQNQRMNKGLVDLAENWEEWQKALAEGNKNTLDFAAAVADCTLVIADLVGTTQDLELSNDFFNIENLQLLEEALNGDIEAINNLGIAVAKEQLSQLQFNQALADEAFGTDKYNYNTFIEDLETVQNKLDEVKLGLINSGDEMGSEWINALNNMAKATGMSVDEMNSLLGSMGVQAQVKVDYVETNMQVPSYTRKTKLQPRVISSVDPITGTKISKTVNDEYSYVVPGKPVDVTGYAAVAQISTEDNPLEANIDEGSKPSGGSSGSSSSGATWIGDRGSIAPSTTEKVKETKETKTSQLKEAFEIDNDQFKSLDEEEERYHEINNELEVLADNLNTISKEKDRAYGANRVKLIDQETAALKQQLSAQERYIDAIEDYFADDRAKMDKYGFMFNEDTDIVNYDEVMDQQIQAYNTAYQTYITAKNAAIDTFNAAVQSGTSEEEAEKIYDTAIKAADATWEAAQKRYETFEKELQQYEESVDLLRQQKQVFQDIKHQIQNLNYEKIQYKLEVKLEVNDAEMRMLDYYLNKFSDDFYSMAEAAQLVTDKIPSMTEALSNYDSFYQELQSAYAVGNISEEAYLDGLKQSYDGILNNLEALQELDEEMMHYYKDTLEMGAEKLAEQTAGFEKFASALEHYHNLITLINGEYDYESIGFILEGKASNLKNELDVATSNYQMLLTERDRIQQLHDNAQTEEARELHAAELEAIKAQVNEAHELMLSKTAEWAEAQKAIMENIMEKAAHDMEKAFTNGMGFDALNNSIQRVSSNSEEYLTKTNQIYETQKLINTTQQVIDKTTNSGAKIRLKNYQDEIKALQDKNKLTNIEIELAKARYDILLAEIALEEAQNAKSTVRLQRDNEGNFGYVYTADQTKVAEAEQNLLDTQNNLYNIRLEAANEYGQKIMDLNQQLADDLMALEQARVEGQFATEAEYQAAKEQILREYYDLYTTYSNIYALASADDARIEQEAWVTAYDDIINKAGDWQYHTDLYIKQCEAAYTDYRITVTTESEIINKLLNGVKESVSDITTESDKLATYIKSTFIPKLQEQYRNVSNVTAAYATQRKGILDLINTYEQLAQSILKAMQAQANLNKLEQTPIGPTVTETLTTIDKIPTNNTSQTDIAMAQKANAVALEAQEIVTKVHTGAIPMHSSGRGWTPSAREMGYSEDAIKVALQAFNDSKPGAGWSYYYKKALELAARFDTGGYTGSWGPTGRLAMLDEKELVLNQEDTENFLVATGILRSIVDLIDINSLYNQFTQLSSVGFTPLGGERLEQNVSIEAYFPNVSDRNEIEEAFNNLINTASQYANRKV